jgi:6-phosphofructokinase 1
VCLSLTKIGVLTAGGDAPGMNAATRSVVRSAIYRGFEVVGFERGYCGLIEGKSCPMGLRSVSGIINLGGTILKTVRCQEMGTPEGIEKAAEALKNQKIDGLVAISGDGHLQRLKHAIQGQRNTDYRNPCHNRQ